ncbi:MAG: FAD-dependent oxidoreductase [Cyclobacteriaceae bacterium]|nr:FAD-dependent oxidoreductase [Cyclobacteriaceae bacterium]
MKEKEVVVIGAGIIGLCSAYFLNKKGFNVTVIDNTDGSGNCSYGNAGFISPSHIIPLASPGIINQGIRWMTRSDSPFFIKPKLNSDLISWGLKFRKAATKKRVAAAVPLLNDLLMSSRTLTEQLLKEEDIDAGFNDKGIIVFCKTQQALDEETTIAERTIKLGQKTEILSAEQARALNPELDLDVLGGVWYREDANLTPHIFIEKFIDVLKQKGVTIKYNQEVSKITSNDDKNIDSIIVNGEKVVADEYVLAAGSWTRDLLKQLDIQLPLQGGKGYSFVLPNPKANLNTCAILHEARVAVTPMLHGLRFAGTMEINGLDLTLNKKRIDGIIRSITKYFPQYTKEDFKDIEPWAGLRPCSPDGLPYIGRTKGYKNLLIATGHAMLGVSLSVITGKLIAQLASNEVPEIDLTLLEVDRYN